MTTTTQTVPDLDVDAARELVDRLLSREAFVTRELALAYDALRDVRRLLGGEEPSTVVALRPLPTLSGP